MRNLTEYELEVVKESLRVSILAKERALMGCSGKILEDFRDEARVSLRQFRRLLADLEK